MSGVADWRSRTRLLFGDEGAARIAAGKVLVAGMGAVGSFAVEALPASRLTCVYSAEPPAPQPAAPECGPRAMGSTVCVTGAFGLAAASAVLERLVPH